MFVLNFVYMFVCIFYKHSGLVSRSLCNIIHKLKHIIQTLNFPGLRNRSTLCC
ncbi:hypothetical protein HanXRQr2_Chr15g0705921 [Helianthus annuus]|uniref:Uncharacterized protein n=1 Tax=Helianthus annuus TaxID=4232 RepID=A0A9K3E3Z9_HELAN|nr:hypothetical protein HanXRQr2_Chr15g0705921 [Helianthus annuus]KAJ0832330.1 hypothetical protein HanPSC8_Chr15g0677551 [Helianthus annuus]